MTLGVTSVAALDLEHAPLEIEAARGAEPAQLAVGAHDPVAGNDHGQRTSLVDPEGNVTTFDYFPENDPDGDGVPVFSMFR